MKLHYHDYTVDRDFFSPLATRDWQLATAARQRKRRVRRVRLWALRRASREVRGGRVCFIAVSIWVLCIAQWLWMRVAA